MHFRASSDAAANGGETSGCVGGRVNDVDPWDLRIPDERPLKQLSRLDVERWQ
jgi:hypothetical protein